MSGLCRQWTESFDASSDRGLTARPVVLAKTYEPGASRSRREWRSGPGVRMLSGDTGCFGAGSAPRSRGGFNPIAPCRFGAVESLIGGLDDFFRRRIVPP